MTVTDIKHLIKRANFRLEDEDFTAARADCEVILAQDDKISEALVRLGDCCFGLGEYEASEDAYRRLLETPSDPDALFGPAAVLRVTECYGKLSLFTNEVSTKNRSEPKPCGTGYLERCLAIMMAQSELISPVAHHPTRMAAHLLAAMTGTKTERAPADYIRDLFDDYADTFDADLLEDLNYVVPHLIKNTLSTHLTTPPCSRVARFERVLDWACGQVS